MVPAVPVDVVDLGSGLGTTLPVVQSGAAVPIAGEGLGP